MKEREICWNITTKCNQNCRYCHRFLNINDLKFEDNEVILRNLIRDGIQKITWTGGETLLYPNMIKLLEIAKENNIKNKLITNGVILSQCNEIGSIINYLDSLTLSIDSVAININKKLRKGRDSLQ